jgi:hypothetical protein
VEATAIIDAEHEYWKRLIAEMPPILDLKDLPKWVGISIRQIRNLRRQGSFPIREIKPRDSRVRFSGASVLRYLQTEGRRA